MNWDAAIIALAAAAAADSVLAGIYGSAIRMGADAQDPVVPSLHYRIITDGAAPEVSDTVVIQWDQWVDTLEQLWASERALRALFHHPDTPITVTGVWFWSMYTDGAILTVPTRSNFYGRAIRFQMDILKEQYT